jgi:hypothetical protein
MAWPWNAAQVVLHDHAENALCNDRCIEVPAVSSGVSDQEGDSRG